MARYWCITCQEEVEHREYYCHSRCGNDCDAVCSRCNTKSLTTALSDSNPNDTERAAIKWATGKAQQQAQRTGKTGEIPIDVKRLDVNGIVYCRTVVYNTASRFASFRT